MEMYGYKVGIDRSCEGEYPEEEFGDWSEDCSNSFRFIARKKENDHPDIVSSLDIQAGDACYVVWVECSTGDSFGSGYRNYVDEIAVFTSIEAAEELQKVLEEDQGGILK